MGEATYNKISSDLIAHIRQSVIGEGRLLRTPFGEKPLVYADYTASGRSLSFIEDYITQNVLPFYANTHSEASATGRQTTAFREQARMLIKASVNGGERDAVIFCGSGATSAIQKIIEIFNLRIPKDLGEAYGFEAQIKDEDRPVVFISAYEHHSNELAWRESIAQVVCIPLNEKGEIDKAVLQSELETYKDRRLKIGSFSAASNVTGLLSDVAGIGRILHAHGALSFWDYAAAAPYVPIDVTGVQDGYGNSALDAVYISPHKFVGGPGTPGVLVIKRALLTNRVPSIPGGGTVSYVSPEGHTYLPAGESKEEGGTPAIVESIRAGLVFQLKDAVGAKTIERLEKGLVERALKRWSRHPNIQILGDIQAPRISILSFLITWNSKPLHYGFVDALMNDLFGIQVRGGCSCAGPYGHELLQIDMDYSRAITDMVDAGYSIMKPGWVRLNFNYFIDEDTFEYILKAVELIADHGWKLLDHYTYDSKRALWVCKVEGGAPVLDLNNISFANAAFHGHQGEYSQNNKPLSAFLTAAEDLMTGPDVCGTAFINALKGATPAPVLPGHYEPLRWYGLPSDLGQDTSECAQKPDKLGLVRGFRAWLSHAVKSGPSQGH